MRKPNHYKDHSVILERNTVLPIDKLMALLVRCEEDQDFGKAIIKNDYLFLMQLKREIGDSNQILISSHDLNRVEVISTQADYFSKTGNVAYWFRGKLLERDDYSGQLTHLGFASYIESCDIRRVKLIKESLPKGGVEYGWAKPVGSQDALFVSQLSQKSEEEKKSRPPANPHPWRRSFKFGGL